MVVEQSLRMTGSLRQEQCWPCGISSCSQAIADTNKPPNFSSPSCANKDTNRPCLLKSSSTLTCTL
jgi:uncharacterized ferredoxin-like protein